MSDLVIASATTAAAEVTYSVVPYDALNSTGQVVKNFPLRERHIKIFLDKQAEGWVLSNAIDVGG